MIKKSFEPPVNKKYRVLIYGVPGIAKSTTAISAPAPLMIDTDRGIDRVPAKHRKCDYTQSESYEELLNDLKGDLSIYQTLIFDTGGALLNLMKAWAIARDPKNGQKDGQTLSMRGYGAVGHEFSRLMDYCYYQLNKNIVLVFHAKEETDEERKVFRLDVEGQTRQNVWKNIDIGGFMEASGNRRVIGFSPTDRYFAKGTHGVRDVYEVPNVMEGAENNFLSGLFKKVTDSIFSESAEVAEEMKKYHALMLDVTAIIAGVNDPTAANDALKKLKELNHVYASKIESWEMLKRHCSERGLVFNKDHFEVKK